MKYVRTKDNRIYEIVENDGTWTTNQLSENIVEKALKGNKYYKDDIQVLKQADTIEELCDGFYLDNEECELVDRFYYYHKKYDCFKSFADSHRGFCRKRFKEYKADLFLRGFIKTDKGLIYVAKMNDKGELELL